jgi:hypothetical protein
MVRFLFSNRAIRALTEGVGTSFSAILNVLLFFSILISVLTPYTNLGLGLVLVISIIEVFFIVNALLSFRRSGDVGYKIIDATVESIISEHNPKTIRSKKKFIIRFTRSENSICYYLEPGERIMQARGVLPVYSNNRRQDTYYGYTPVELYFQTYYPEGTERQVEIITETRKEQLPKTGSITFYSHDNPERLSLLINFDGLNITNGNKLTTKLQYFKGREKKVVENAKVILLQQDTCGKVVWESDTVVNNAIYDMEWSYD